MKITQGLFGVAALLAIISTAHPAQAQAAAQAQSQTLFDQRSGSKSAKVTQIRGTCTLKYTAEDLPGGFSFSIGSTYITSTFFVFGTANIGPNANGTGPREYTLERLTAGGWNSVSAGFTKRTIGDGTFKLYQSDLTLLDFDLSDLEKTSAFRLSRPGSAQITVDFSDAFGRSSVSAMRSCVKTLPKAWSIRR